MATPRRQTKPPTLHDQGKEACQGCNNKGGCLAETCNNEGKVLRIRHGHDVRIKCTTCKGSARCMTCKHKKGECPPLADASS